MRVNWATLIIPGLCFFVLLEVSSAKAEQSPDTIGRSADQGSTLDIIQSTGFKAEFYSFRTKKGFRLNLYRIINPLADPNKLNKFPVLYGHGVVQDSQTMVSRSEHALPRKPVIGKPTINYFNEADKSDDYSLPFMFSNNNFDVWLYDARATTDKNRNISVELDPGMADSFWDYSLDDQALDDLPTTIDFVLDQTKAKKLVYVGYSQSTLFMFSLLSMKPQYSDKLVAYVAIGPAAYVHHTTGAIIPIWLFIDMVTPKFVNYDFLPSPVLNWIDATLRGLCKTKIISKLVCGPVVTALGGPGTSYNSPNFFTYFFKSTSLKVVRHFLQMWFSGKYQMYDYGKNMNLKKYGQIEPPQYNLTRIVSDRIILCRAGHDYLSHPEDQKRLLKELGTKPYKDIFIQKYSHFDFVDGKDLVRLVNAPVMEAVYELMYKEGPNIIKTPQ